jgi:hypothetical protein
MSGIVGSMGNLGGIIFALIFRFQPVPLGKAFWICGIIIMVRGLFRGELNTWLILPNAGDQRVVGGNPCTKKVESRWGYLIIILPVRMVPVDFLCILRRRRIMTNGFHSDIDS